VQVVGSNDFTVSISNVKTLDPFLLTITGWNVKVKGGGMIFIDP
jgi:hypothetical protein